MYKLMDPVNINEMFNAFFVYTIHMFSLQKHICNWESCNQKFKLNTVTSDSKVEETFSVVI